MTTPNDLPSVGTEDAPPVSFQKRVLNRMLNDFALACMYGDDLSKRMATSKVIHDHVAAVVSERDELASRVRELEGEREQAMRNRDMWKGQCERQAETLGMYHAKSTGLERDGLRYRYMRDLRIEQTGMPGQPCIAMPNGMLSGYYLTEETADHAVDTSISALASKEHP